MLGFRIEKAHPPCLDFINGTDAFHAALLAARLSFRGFMKRAHHAPNVHLNGLGESFLRGQSAIESLQSRNDAIHKKLDARVMPHALTHRGDRRLNRSAAFVTQHDQERSLQMFARVLHASCHLWRNDIPGHSDDKQFTKTSIKDHLGCDTGVAASKNRRERMLTGGQFRQGLSGDAARMRFATKESLIPLNQSLQRLVGGEFCFHDVMIASMIWSSTIFMIVPVGKVIA